MPSKFKVSLGSAEGKRALHRHFYGFQANLYVVSSIGRLKLAPAAVEQVEQAMRARLEQRRQDARPCVRRCRRLFKKHAIETPATFDALPLELAVGVIDSLGRRYLELIQKLDH